MTTRDLTKALAIIGNWEILCENLGVKKATIENLKMSREPIETQKFRCLEAYRSQKGGCWEEIIKVVADDPFYKEQLAMKIAKQHGIDYSSLSHGIEDEL